MAKKKITLELLQEFSSTPNSELIDNSKEKESEETIEYLSKDNVEDINEKSEETKEEIVMGKYIGVVNIKGNFYNFTPIGVYEDGVYTSYSENDLDELLPQSIKHNINFYYNFWDDNNSKFMKETFQEEQLVVLECEIDDLELNRMPDGQLNHTGYKINAMEAWNKGKIFPLSGMGLYVVLTKDALIDDVEEKRTIRIDHDGIVVGEKVLVNLGNGFFAGPFAVKYSQTNNTLFIVMQAAEGKHFIYGYNVSDCERVVIEPSLDVENWIGYSSWDYCAIKDNAIQKTKDLISDKDLLESFKHTLDKSKELDYSNLDIQSIIEKLGTSQIVGKDIPDEIREQRIERLQRIMSAEEDFVQVYSETADIICELLIKNKDSMQTEKLLDEMLEKRPELFDKMQSVRAIQAKVENVRAELEQLEAQRIEMESKVRNVQETAEENIASTTNYDEILSAELNARKTELEAIQEQLGVASSAIELQAKIEKLKEEVRYYDNHKLHLMNDVKSLESNFVERVNGYSERIADITFDGFISSKMLQAAANWENKEKKKNLKDKISLLNDIQVTKLNDAELIDYLVKTIQLSRPGYDKNTIINIFICITQGFLTVFSGLPGCGKTSICNIVTRVLGLNNYEKLAAELKDLNRYVSVSVERGWTSKQDFIGYYNPLTKAFEENNRNIFDGLSLLDEEKKNGFLKWPFIILLDEANLSPMEYYWADFMNICDDLSEHSSINLGADNIFCIPETLHFLATINNDHTTETLSPRLIDRAWIITLPKNTAIQYNQEISDEQIRNVTWDEIKNVFTPIGAERKGFDRETQSIYDGLKEKLLRQGLYISPRVDIAIQKYWVVASKLMEEDEYGNSSNLVALDYAIAQKILPKIIGSGEDYGVWLEELNAYCNNKGLSNSAEILTSIVTRGNRQMKYYQFFN